LTASQSSLNPCDCAVCSENKSVEYNLSDPVPSWSCSCSWGSVVLKGHTLDVKSTLPNSPIIKDCGSSACAIWIYFSSPSGGAIASSAHCTKKEFASSHSFRKGSNAGKIRRLLAGVGLEKYANR